MKLLLGYCILLCIFLTKVQSKPQITKLFPVKELAEFHERTNEIKPFDKFLSKLRATYNFVFNKQEDTSNVEKILSTNAPQNPEIEALKLILANVISPKTTTNSDSETIKDSRVEGRGFESGNEKENSITIKDNKSTSENSDTEISTESTNNDDDDDDDWIDGIEPAKTKTLVELELQDDENNNSQKTTPSTNTLQLPMALGKHLLEWLGTLLGLTYGAYARVAQAIKT